MLNVRKFASHMLISISKLNGLTIMRNSNLTGEMWPTESCFSLGKIHVFICELNGSFFVVLLPFVASLSIRFT